MLRQTWRAWWTPRRTRRRPAPRRRSASRTSPRSPPRRRARGARAHGDAGGGQACAARAPRCGRRTRATRRCAPSSSRSSSAPPRTPTHAAAADAERERSEAVSRSARARAAGRRARRRRARARGDGGVRRRWPQPAARPLPPALDRMRRVIDEDVRRRRARWRTSKPTSRRGRSTRGAAPGRWNASAENGVARRRLPRSKSADALPSGAGAASAPSWRAGRSHDALSASAIPASLAQAGARARARLGAHWRRVARVRRARGEASVGRWRARARVRKTPGIEPGSPSSNAKPPGGMAGTTREARSANCAGGARCGDRAGGAARRARRARQEARGARRGTVPGDVRRRAFGARASHPGVPHAGRRRRVPGDARDVPGDDAGDAGDARIGERAARARRVPHALLVRGLGRGLEEGRAIASPVGGRAPRRAE